MEITYWDEKRQVRVRFGLRRFDLVCCLVIFSALVLSLSSGGFSNVDRAAVLWLVEVFSEVGLLSSR